MMDKREIFFYDELIDLGIATEEEISLVKYCMGGTWKEALESILYARTCCRTIEQLFDEEEEEE